MHWERHFVSEYTGCRIIQCKTHRIWSMWYENQCQITQGNGLLRFRVRRVLQYITYKYILADNQRHLLVLYFFSWNGQNASSSAAMKGDFSS